MRIIFHFFSFATAIVNLIFSVRFYFRYQQSKMKTMLSCSLSSLLAFLAFIILALPQLFLFDSTWIQIAFISVDILLLGFVLGWSLVLLELMEWPSYKTIIFKAFSYWVLIYIFLNMLFFSPSIQLVSDGEVYYWISGTLWLQSINRALLMIAALVISAVFFYWSKTFQEEKEKKLFWRVFIIGIGPIITATGGFIFWVFPLFYFSPFLLILSSLLGFLGFFTSFIVSVVVIRFPQEKSLKK